MLAQPYHANGFAQSFPFMFLNTQLSWKNDQSVFYLRFSFTPKTGKNSLKQVFVLTERFPLEEGQAGLDNHPKKEPQNFNW